MTDSYIAQLPTGTIDNLQAVIPMEIGMPSAPQTIQSSLLQFAQFLGANGYGTLTNNFLSVSGTDVSAVVNNRYFLNVSTLTADRNLLLPSGTVGDTVEAILTSGNDTHELIIKGKAGVTINGGAAATEWSRLFIASEKVRLIMTSGGNWQVVEDERIPCKGVMTRTGTAGNAAHSAGAETTADWNSIELNVGGIADTTNDRFNIRRDGYYAPVGSYCPAVAIADQKYAFVMLFKNSTKVAAGGLRQSSTAGSGVMLAAAARKPVLFAAGDTCTYKFVTEDANMGLGRTDNSTALLEQITFFAIDEIL